MSEGQPLPSVYLHNEKGDPTIKALQEANLGDSLGVRLFVGEPGTTLEEAAEMLNSGKYDIVIAGIDNKTSDVLDVAIHKVGSPEKFISSFFIMEKDNEEPMFFADCAIHHKDEPEKDKPIVDKLVRIAEQTSESVRHLGHEPVVAFLSFSTAGSGGDHEDVATVRKAARKFNEKNKDIKSFGEELQFDAAFDKDVLEKKTGKKVDKMPNVFIFPDLNSANIGYKIAERLGNRIAIGPMLQGTAKDIHDQSRGAGLPGLVRSIEVAAQLYQARQAAKSS